MNRKVLPLIAVLVAAATVALVAVGAPFTYDDKVEVIGNPAVRAAEWWLAVPAYNPWRAGVLYTYAINWQVGGLEPTGYHLVSIAIHLANAGLAYRLLAGVMPLPKALFAIALWAVHPMTTEGVTYISGRSDALVTLWVLIATERWLVDARSPNPRARMVAFGATILAFLTKETAVALPVILWAAEWALVAGGRAKLVDWRRYIPFGLVAVGVAVARVGWLGWPVPEVPRTVSAHVVTQAEVWTRYLQLWLVPWGQSIVHPVQARVSPLGLASTVGWAVIGWWSFRRGGVVAFGAALWGATLWVSSAFVLKETMAEHRSYAAGLGLAMGVAALLPGHRSVWCIPAVFAALCTWRNVVWQSEASLWRQATSQWPESADPWYGYGDALRLEARWPDAEAAYLRATELEPERADAWVNLGIVRTERGNETGALAAWERALVVRPGHCAALNNLAALRVKQGDTLAAASGFAATLRSCPDDATANYQLAVLSAASGDQSRAIFHLRMLLKSNPDAPTAGPARALLHKLGAEE